MRPEFPELPCAEVNHGPLMVGFQTITRGKGAVLGVVPHVNTAYTIFSTKLLYNLTTLCLNGTLPCVDFRDVIMGDLLLVTCHKFI